MYSLFPTLIFESVLVGLDSVQVVTSYFQTSDCSGIPNSFSQTIENTVCKGGSQFFCTSNPAFLEWPGYVTWPPGDEGSSECLDEAHHSLTAYVPQCISNGNGRSTLFQFVNNTEYMELQYASPNCNGPVDTSVLIHSMKSDECVVDDISGGSSYMIFSKQVCDISSVDGCSTHSTDTTVIKPLSIEIILLIVMVVMVVMGKKLIISYMNL